MVESGSSDNNSEREEHNDLLAHFIEGTAVSEDAVRLREWLSANPDSGKMVHRFVDEVCLRDAASVDARAALKRVTERMTGNNKSASLLAIPSHANTIASDAIVEPIDSRSLRSVTGDPSFFSRESSAPTKSLKYVVAAGFALTLAFFAGWQLRPNQQINRPLNAIGSAYSTAAGQRATITLPDQSEVILNVSSRLETSADYAEGNRIVYLKGEAMFTVRHHGSAPFTVISENGRTEVLGTRFLVRRYSTDSVTTVVVRDGKVRVGGSTTLSAGQQGLIGDASRVSVQPAEMSRFSFTDGVLVLPEMRMVDALIKLNRWYDADIRLGAPVLESKTIGGEFTSGSLGDLVSFLELTLDVKVRRNGRVLTLFPKEA